MSDENNKDLLLGDPLSEVTRKERRMLLAISMIGITLVKMGLIPTKISTLGIEFEKTNQQSLLNIIALIVIYFLAAFFIYAIADFLAWRKSIRNKKINIELESIEKELINPQLFHEQKERMVKISSWRNTPVSLTKPVSVLRAIFEFLLPIVVGIYSSYILITNDIAGT